MIIFISILSILFYQNDDDFFLFEKRLHNIILNKDISLLKEVLHDTVFESNDICGYPGCPKEKFISLYFSDQQREKNWETLLSVVNSGFQQITFDSAIVLFDGSSLIYEAPYYNSFIDTRYELVTNKKTPLHKSPSHESKILTVLDSATVLKCKCCKSNRHVQNENWVEVQYDPWGKAFLRKEDTSNNQYRILEVAKIKGKWRVVSWYLGECF